MKIPFCVALSGLLLVPSLLWAASPSPLPDDPKCTAADRVFMKRAYELADEAVKKGNAPFEVVLAANGKIIAEYTNKVATTNDPTKHAELGLISRYVPTLDHATIRRSTLYASSEPCIMCSGAILNAGIPKVVYGTTKAQFQSIITNHHREHPVTCREIMSRTNPQVEVLGPLMERDGLALHEAYWPEAMKKWSRG